MQDIPSNPQATLEYTLGDVKITWSPVNHATSYIVYGSSLPDTGFEQLSEVTTNEYICNTAGRCYFYKVVAVNNSSAR